MPVLPREAFARRLDALSPTALRDFAADVWAARGFDTRVGDGDDSLTVTRDGVDRTVVPVATRRLRGLSSVPGGVDPDVVVDGSGTDAGRSLAADHDASYVGPGDLYHRLLYGVDREVAAGLLHRHLGAPLHVDESPTTPAGSTDRPEPTAGDDDGRSGLGLLRRATPDGGDLTTALVVGAVVVAALVVGLGPGALTGLVPGDGTGSTPGDPVDVTGGQTGVNDTNASGSVGAIGATPDYPPGLSRDGVDGEALSDAHHEYLSNRSYTLVERSDAPHEATRRDWEHHRRTVQRVESESRFLESTRGWRTFENGTGDRFTVDQYTADGLSVSRVNASDEPVEYRVRRGHRNDPRGASWRVEHYLSGENATVTEEETADGRRFRVVDPSPPTDWRENDRVTVTDYRAEATVHPAGYVTSLSVRMTFERNGSVGEGRFVLEYDDVGNTSVSEPPFVDEALANASNGTTPARTENATATPAPE
ncbi:hypothetical protein ACFO0N_13170 [Halobium salinum]|uniref:Uncharacterized protein n=1 Tax=Halobium salinum TaxID=1364940 RepID=A0ABD5PEF1_9EURY|nr:hypothetical protein [Halobium salinum]